MIACGWIMSFDFLASGQMSLPFVRTVWLEPQTLKHEVSVGALPFLCTRLRFFFGLQGALELCCWIQLLSRSFFLTGIVLFRLGDVTLRPRLETERANCLHSAWCFIPALLQPVLALDLSFGGEQVLVSASCCAV